MTQQPKTDGLDALKEEIIAEYAGNFAEMDRVYPDGYAAAMCREMCKLTVTYLAQRGMLNCGWMPIESAPRDGVIPLTRGLCAIVDIEDMPKLQGQSWQARERHDKKCWYAANSDGERMHRVVMGVNDDGVIVDHINGNGLDNRKHNLRIGCQSLNSVNRRTTPGAYLRGTRPKKGKWQSYIKIDGKQKSLGYFDTEQEAHEAYIKAAKNQYGDWMPLPAAPKMEGKE